MTVFEDKIARIKAQNEKRAEFRRINALERTRLRREEKAANGILTNRGRKLTEDVPDDIKRIRNTPVDQLNVEDLTILRRYEQQATRNFRERQKALAEEKIQQDNMLNVLNIERRKDYDIFIGKESEIEFFKNTGIKYNKLAFNKDSDDKLKRIRINLQIKYKFRRLSSLDEDREPLFTLSTLEEREVIKEELIEEQIRQENARRPGRPRGSRRKIEDKSLEEVQALNDKELSRFLKQESALSRTGSYQSTDTQKDFNNRLPLPENVTASVMRRLQINERWNAIKQKQKEEKLELKEKQREEAFKRAIARSEARETKKLEIEQLFDIFDRAAMRHERNKIRNDAKLRDQLLTLMRKYSFEVFQEYAYSFCLIKGHMYTLSEEELDALEIEFQRTGKVPTKL